LSCGVCSCWPTTIKVSCTSGCRKITVFYLICRLSLSLAVDRSTPSHGEWHRLSLLCASMYTVCMSLVSWCRSVWLVAMVWLDGSAVSAREMTDCCARFQPNL
jgi:hypothetical protein